MYLPLRPLVIVFVGAFIFPAIPAKAQRGDLIEGLFRTIAEAQLEREKARQDERQRQTADARAAEQQQSQATNPYEVQLPSGLGAGRESARPDASSIPPAGRRPPLTTSPGNRSQSRSINVRSREAAQFAGELVAFNRSIDKLSDQSRAVASRDQSFRPLLPGIYAIAADGQALIRRCDGIASLSSIVDPYRQLDARYRQLSFDLRSRPSLSGDMRSMIRECDRLCSSMARQLKIQPQIDRVALRDMMVQATTYMQALLDDLQLARISDSKSQQLAHDCRLLRQRLLGEADHVAEYAYEDVVTRFTDFAAGWSQFSAQAYALNDAHVRRRLDRISQCGDETYALLWMPPPISNQQVSQMAHRLDQSLAALLDQLTFRSIVSLSRDEQRRVLDTSRSLYGQARSLEDACEKGAPRSELAPSFAEISRTWASLRGTLASMGTINQGTIAEIDHTCHQLSLALDVRLDAAPIVDTAGLLQSAAALEGGSEYLDADLQRYARYLQPQSYRDSLLAGSREFHLHAKRLHELLSRPDSGYGQSGLEPLQREAEHMLDGWDQMSRDLSHIEGHGLSSSRAERIKQSQRDLVPAVAQVAAALLDR